MWLCVYMSQFIFFSVCLFLWLVELYSTFLQSRNLVYGTFSASLNVCEVGGLAFKIVRLFTPEELARYYLLAPSRRPRMAKEMGWNAVGVAGRRAGGGAAKGVVRQEGFAVCITCHFCVLACLLCFCFVYAKVRATSLSVFFSFCFPSAEDTRHNADKL